MLPTLLTLGQVAGRTPLLTWLAAKLGPAVGNLLNDPQGTLHRVGDVLVWGGESGQRVLALLEDLSGGQNHLAASMQNIETAQIKTAASLGALVPLAMFGLGVTALATHLMKSRLDALDRRLQSLEQQVADVKAMLAARLQADLEVSLRHLELYDREHKEAHLHTAFQQSAFATSVYRALVRQEATGPRRLPVLHHCGRCYLLALMTQARCRVLAEDADDAERTLAGERETLVALARTMFEEVLGKTPEIYLAPQLSAEGVTLEVLAEVYQQAHRAGAVRGEYVRDAAQLFEVFRSKLFGTGRLIGPLHNQQVRSTVVSKLKLLMACLEEVNRVESLRLRIDVARRAGGTLKELEEAVRQQSDRDGTAGGPDIHAYALA